MTRSNSLLVRIAEQMKDMAREAAEHAPPANVIRHTLTGGAKILVKYDASPRQWHLCIQREDVFPSDVEMGVFRAAFGVPGGTARQPATSADQHIKGYVLVWTEAVVMPLLSTPVPPAVAAGSDAA